MFDLIEALQIFSKYCIAVWPTHCEHDELYVNVDPQYVSEEDKTKLDKLGFYPDGEEECFVSYKFGSS